MSVIFAILLFSFLVVIHEFGHFLAAKSFGIQVNEFSLFMGPAIWKKQVGETLYSIRCLPFGGFCAMEGEDDGSTSERSFASAPWWKRVIVLVAGAAMNFLAGILLLFIFVLPDQQFVVPVIDSCETGCSFYGEAGILPGDRIIEVDGERIYTYSDFSTILSIHGGNIHDLVLERAGKKIVLDDLSMEKRSFPNEDGTESLRYGFSFSIAEATLPAKMKMTWNMAMSNARIVKLSLQMLVQGQAGIQDMSGPVGIVQQMADVADASASPFYALLNLLYFGGFIAINLAVMNLLPIPALDGGRIAGVLIITGIERISGKKLDPKYEGYVHGFGMILLLGLMALLMFKDILFVFKG